MGGDLHAWKGPFLWLHLTLSLARSLALRALLFHTLSCLQLSPSLAPHKDTQLHAHMHTHSLTNTLAHSYAQIFSHTHQHTSGAEQMESGDGPYTGCLKTTTPSQSPQTHRALPQSSILICRNCLAPYSWVRSPMDCQGAVPAKMPLCEKRGEGGGGGGPRSTVNVVLTCEMCLLARAKCERDSHPDITTFLLL